MTVRTGNRILTLPTRDQSEKKKMKSEDYWAKVKVSVLVAAGGASPAWFHNTADALARVLPRAARQTLEGQTHAVTPEAIAPVLVEFFRESSDSDSNKTSGRKAVLKGK